MKTTPYLNDRINLQLIIKLMSAGFDFSENNALCRVAVVGALIDQNDNLFTDDYKTIFNALTALSNAGIAISNHLQFQFFSLNQPCRNNFLVKRAAVTDADKTDIVIISGLPSADKRMSYRQVPHMNWPYQSLDEAYQDMNNRLPCDRLLATAPDHHLAIAWEKSAYSRGAKIIVTRGGLVNDLTIGTFCSEGSYTKLIGNEEHFMHEKTIGMSVPGGFGFAARTQDLAELSKQANDRNLVGQRLLELAAA